jgi:hypothetical protein
MDKNLYKPGTDNLPGGEYKEVGPRGGELPHGRQFLLTPATGFLQPRKRAANGNKSKTLQKVTVRSSGFHISILLLEKQKLFPNIFI